MKQTAMRRDRNVATKRDIKLAVKAFMAKPSQETLSEAQSKIDTAVKKNVLNKTTAARRKAALAKHAKDAGVKLSCQEKSRSSLDRCRQESACEKASCKDYYSCCEETS